MNPVIPFPPKSVTTYDLATEDGDSTEYTIVGTGVCLNCKHEWQAIAPTGVVSLECPSCNAHRGVWKGLAGPDSGNVWTCNCGCQYFMLTDTHTLCIGCGTHHTF